MSTEGAFLEALAADLGDDVTRLVYADWLDERGDERGAFLRAEVELGSLPEDDPRATELNEQLARRCPDLPAEWLRAAGKRWDVWLTGYERTKKISVIKTIRALTGCGLMEGKLLSESLPARVLISCTRDEVEQARARLADAAQQIAGCPIRPCPDPVAVSQFQPVGLFEILILGAFPGREAELAGLLNGRGEGRPLLDRLRLSANDVAAVAFPQFVGWVVEDKEARADVERLSRAALAELRPGPRRPAGLSSYPRMREGEGPFDVRLVSYPPERRLQVCRTLVLPTYGFTPLSTAEALALTARSPVLLGESVHRARALQLQSQFSLYGPVEVVASAG